jgi:hypothetical protein
MIEPALGHLNACVTIDRVLTPEIHLDDDESRRSIRPPARAGALILSVAHENVDAAELRDRRLDKGATLLVVRQPHVSIATANNSFSSCEDVMSAANASTRQGSARSRIQDPGRLW